MARHRRDPLVPEFTEKVKRTRAGFAPNHDDGDEDVVTWQLWCRSADGDDSRRAKVSDVKRAGFAWRKRR